MQALGKKINRFMHVKELATTGTPTTQGQKPNCTFLNPFGGKIFNSMSNPRDADGS